MPMIRQSLSGMECAVFTMCELFVLCYAICMIRGGWLWAFNPMSINIATRVCMVPYSYHVLLSCQCDL